MVPRWERRAPGRFAYELHDLAWMVGDTLRVDENALEQGALFVNFEWPLQDRLVPLRALYPDSFPRTRPIVLLRTDAAEFPRRHCSPNDGTLCLLGRDARQWPNQWSLAELLRNQLADALNGTGDEDEQGEPAEYWWNFFGLPHSYCLVDSQWSLQHAKGGMLKLAVNFRGQGEAPSIQALVREVRDENKRQVCSWQAAIPPALGARAQELMLPWIYCDEILLPGPQAGDQLVALRNKLHTQPKVVDFSHTTSAQIFAVAYRSELSHQQTGLTWMFPVFHGGKHQFSGKGGARKQQPQVAVIPTMRAGASDLGARVPAVGLLRDKRIAVIGLGALGAPVALELARSGCGQLRLVDHDVVEPGNSIRWPLGTSAWGVKKAEGLAAFINREYPWCDAQAYVHAIGQFDAAKPTAGDSPLLEKVLEQVDVVVDASTSQGVLNALWDECAQRSLALVTLYASPPVHGGAVVRFAPNSGCPTCLEIAHDEGTISRAPGFGKEDQLQQPPGCAERTFTGASFDLQELSLQAVRLLVRTLQDAAAAKSSLVQTLSLVDDQGQAVLPRWSESALAKSLACSCQTQRP